MNASTKADVNNVNWTKRNNKYLLEMLLTNKLSTLEKHII